MPGGNVAFALAGLGWLVVLWMYLRHRIVLSSDSMNNHVHVWWIARDLWHHGRIPFDMPVLGHGDAYAYPYGFVNWTSAALVWPLFGDWAVTLWTAIGAVGCIVATFFAFPELRRSWWAAAVLLNPAIVYGLLFGQQSFLWGAASAPRRNGVLAAQPAARGGRARRARSGCARRRSCCRSECWSSRAGSRSSAGARRSCGGTRSRSRSRCPRSCSSSCRRATRTRRHADRLVNFIDTLGPRVAVVALPVLLVLMRRTGRRALAPAGLALTMLFGAALHEPLGARDHGWKALVRTANTTSLEKFLASEQFRPAATYRVLRGPGDGKVGLYLVLKAGGHLDAEFFPESMAIRDFDSPADYLQMLCRRHVDYVLAFNSYDPSRHTNEHELLRAVASPGGAGFVREIEHAPGHETYAVDLSACPNPIGQGVVRKRVRASARAVAARARQAGSSRRARSAELRMLPDSINTFGTTDRFNPPRSLRTAMPLLP